MARNFNKCRHCRLASRCLPAELEKKIVRHFDRLTFRARILQPGDHLCYQGDHVESLFALRSGILKSYISQPDGEELVMGFYLPPDLFGWEGIDKEQLSTSIVALDHANICEIPIKTLKALHRRFPEIHHQFLRMVSRHIKKANAVLLRGNTEQRVANFLLDHAHFIGASKISHQDIANYLRMKPETISRAFHNLHDKKIIKIQRRKINISNIESLKDLANV